ncbi:MAG: DUF1266 domain-containing protein [Cytophagales bacterium]|jgi:hypothetical protein|nr:DUF1266 domain-containing protein [Cytophagales bacterium]
MAKKLTPAQIRILCTGAVLFEFRGEPVDDMPDLDFFDDYTNKIGLQNMWSISSPETAVQTLDWLANTGHRTDLADSFRQDYAEWQEVFSELDLFENTEVTSIAAWDYARLVNVARWCFDAKYIDASTFWRYAHHGAEMAQKEFGSWRAFGQSLLAGRIVWNVEDENHEDVADVIEELLEDGAWKQHAWEQPLA